jgi:hypothetical protein
MSKLLDNEVISKTSEKISDIVENVSETSSVFTKNILLNIEEHHTFYIKTSLILFIVISNIVLITLRNTSKINDKEYKDFFNELYHDFLKYIFIEIALVVSEIMESRKINLLSSLARISIVLSALLIFHLTKDKIGIH